jgi:hypothetical protein
MVDGKYPLEGFLVINTDNGGNVSPNPSVQSPLIPYPRQDHSCALIASDVMAMYLNHFTSVDNLLKVWRKKCI